MSKLTAAVVVLAALIVGGGLVMAALILVDDDETTPVVLVEPATTTTLVPTTTTVAPTTTLVPTTTTVAPTTAVVPTTTTEAPPTTTNTHATEEEAPRQVCEFGDHREAVLAAVWQVGGVGDGAGTAFYIGDGEWLTAAHVVGEAQDAVLYSGSRSLPVSVVGTDTAGDVALLVGSGVGTPPLVLTEDPAQAGDVAYVVGFPLYDELTASVSRGVVSRLEQDRFLGTVVVTDAATNPGNSGGPLVDACGQVVGMVVRKFVDVTVEGLGYAVATKELKRHLPGLRSGGGTRSGTEVTEPWWTFHPEVMFPSVSGEFSGPYTNTAFPHAAVEASDFEGPWSPASGSGPWLGASCDFWSLYPGLVVDDQVEVTYRVDAGSERATVWAPVEDSVHGILHGAEAAELTDLLRRSPSARQLTLHVQGIGTATFPLRGYASQRAQLDGYC